MPMSTTFQGGLRYSSYSPHLRRSLPTLSHMSNEPPKIYPYHLLVITNYRLPADVDRCNLEVGLFFFQTIIIIIIIVITTMKDKTRKSARHNKEAGNRNLQGANSENKNRPHVPIICLWLWTEGCYPSPK